MFVPQAKDSIIFFGTFGTINGVQSFDWDPTFNEEQLKELGNKAITAQIITPEISASFEVNSTAATVSIMHRMLMTFDGMGEFTGYAFASGTPNLGTIRSLDFENMAFDLIEAKKPGESFIRSTLLPRLFLSSWAMTASVDGTAKETYSLEGDLGEVYKTPFHDLQAVIGTRVDSTTFDMPVEFYSDTPTGSLIGTEFTVLKVFIDNDEIAVADIVATDAASAAPTTLDITASGKTVVVGARISIIVSRDTPGAFPTILNPTSSRFQKADEIDIWLVSVATVDIAALADGSLMTQSFVDNDLFLRVQNVDVNLDLQRESLSEIKRNDRGNSVFARRAVFPLNITANVTAFETDLKQWAVIQGKPEVMNATFDPTEILNLADFEDKIYQIVVRYYKAGTALQTVAITDARVSGRGSSIAVDGNTEISWSFSGSEIVIEGVDG